MKINVIVPFTFMTGGIRVVFEYCNRLKKRGYDVKIYVPMIAYSFKNRGVLGIINRLKESLGNTFKRGKRVNWFDLNVEIKLVPYICNTFIRDADICIATAWPTAYDVERLNKKKGKKVYFIQHYEVWSGKKELVDNSYRLDLNQIVIAKWLKNLMKENFNKESKLIYNGIDESEFYFGDKPKNKDIVISILYHNLEWKGFSDGIKAIELVKKKYPNIKVKAFGTEKGLDIPEYIEFYENPKRDTLKKIYIESDIYVFPSRNEGWGLTIIEAMACKCCVIGTNTGALSEVGKNNENSLISKPMDIESLSNDIIKVIEDDKLRKKLSNNGFELALNFEWNKSVDKLENFFRKIN